MSSGATDEILGMTGRAWCNHSCAGLTMERIVAESPAPIHRRHSVNEAPLNAFLDDLSDPAEERLGDENDDQGSTRPVFPCGVRPGRDEGFPVALVRPRTRTPYHEQFRERGRGLGAGMRAVLESVTEHLDGSGEPAVGRDPDDERAA